MTERPETLSEGVTTPGDDDVLPGAVLSIPKIALHATAALDALRDVDQARYEVRGEIARGGMGRILDAWDVQNERRVAIKMLLRGGLEAERRFVREARITARLQHPAIVTLYEAGRWSRGQPFFAMKLVLGKSLSHAIADCQTMTDKLSLLPHLVTATEALAYAHAEGIVHRDLKPSNVLVGAFGETVVIDWGLAKDVRDPADLAPPSGPYRDHERDDALTGEGRALGTPCYMPPEQARGDAIDARADVYALGAMLYHVLAGAPPYERATSKDTLVEVLAGAPASLATRAPDAPTELVTVVEKAMARDAAERYPSAREMAAELERFMAGQRLESHEYSVATLVRRFVVRHRAAVVVAVVLSLALAIGGVLSVRRIARDRDHAQRMEALALTREQAAKTQRDAAEKLVDYMIVDLRSRLESVGRLDVMEGLGGEVERYYRATSPFADLDDARALERRAAAVDTLADVEESRHDFDRAREAHRLSIDIGERALALDPTREDARYAVGDTLVRLAALEISAGRLDAASLLLDRARGLARVPASSSGLAAPSDGARFVYLEGCVDQRVAWIRQQKGDLEGAYQSATVSRDALERAVGAGGTSKRWEIELAYAWQLLGTLDVERGELELASTEYDRAITIRARRADALASSPAVDLEQSFAYDALGDVALLRKDLATADRAFHKAYDYRAALASRDPENAEWQRFLAIGKSNLCSLAQRRHDLAAAEIACRDALDILKRLANVQPANAKVKRDLALAYRSFGRVRLARKATRAAVESFAAAVDVARALVDGDPDNATNQQLLARTERWLARGRLASGATDAARDVYERALALAAALHARSPSDATNEEELASIELLGGDIARAQHDDPSARRLYASARDRFASLVSRAPHNVEYVEFRDEAAARLAKRTGSL